MKSNIENFPGRRRPGNANFLEMELEMTGLPNVERIFHAFCVYQNKLHPSKMTEYQGDEMIAYLMKCRNECEEDFKKIGVAHLFDWTPTNGYNDKTDPTKRILPDSFTTKRQTSSKPVTLAQPVSTPKTQTSPTKPEPVSIPKRKGKWVKTSLKTQTSQRVFSKGLFSKPQAKRA